MFSNFRQFLRRSIDEKPSKNLHSIKGKSFAKMLILIIIMLLKNGDNYTDKFILLKQLRVNDIFHFSFDHYYFYFSFLSFYWSIILIKTCLSQDVLPSCIHQHYLYFYEEREWKFKFNSNFFLKLSSVQNEFY